MTREIALTQGQVALVDDGDFDWLMQWKWYANRTRNGGFYAYRATSRAGGKKSAKVAMHRAVLGLPGNQIPDHRNGNGLDNRRSNLRPATYRLNQGNTRLPSSNTSGFRGVSRCPHNHNRWLAYISERGTRRRLGSFPSKEAAARTYDEAAIRIFGEFATLNFPSHGFTCPLDLALPAEGLGTWTTPGPSAGGDSTVPAARRPVEKLVLEGVSCP